MDKAVEDGSYPTWDMVQSLLEKFNVARGQAGKVRVQAKQVLGCLNNRRRLRKGKNVLVPEKSNCTLNDGPSKITTVNSDEVLSERETINISLLEFEARSSQDGAWYDVESFRKLRMLESGEKEVCVRFAGFGAEDDEWINVENAVRRRSLPCDAFNCVCIKPGDLICCFQESTEQAKYFDAHILDVKRKHHDVHGCCCMFLIRYDHDQTEEIVPLQRVYQRPYEGFINVIT